MLTLDVRVETFEAASAIFGRRLAPALDSAYAGLTDALRSCGSMAGSDQAGRTWAASYDAGAQQVAGLIAGLADGCTQLAALLEQTGFNHGRAESQSDPARVVPTAPDRTRYAVMAGGNVCQASVPSAAGGMGGGPLGWSLVQHAIGCAWPNGDTGTLRRAGGAWGAAAARLRDLATLVDLGVDAISSQRSPEIPYAVTACQGMRSHIVDTAAACSGLADACSALAGYVDHAHSQLGAELASLAEWTAATEAAGAVVGVVTLGGAEVAAQAAEAARVARVAARVTEILRAMSASVAALLDTIALSLARAAAVAGRVQFILGARVSVAATTLVERLPQAERERGSIRVGEAARAEAKALAELEESSALALRLRDADGITKGNLPIDGPPNGVLVKRAPDGTVTNYSVYDADGYITKRVDLAGRAHNGLPTPHVSDYAHDIDPSGGVHPRELEPRPPHPGELP